jgi:hypothetical protein
MSNKFAKMWLGFVCAPVLFMAGYFFPLQMLAITIVVAACIATIITAVAIFTLVD